jgi:hypothetical protein
MFTTKFLSLTALAGLVVAATPALARHGHVTSVQGAYGRGYVHSRSVARAPGSLSVNRNTLTNSGRGIASSRQANWGDGTYNGAATHTLNNGDSFGRATSVTRNGDGSASYTTTHTALNGDTRTRSGTVAPH